MYKPTVRSARRAYTQLNRLLFKNQLPPSRHIIMDIGNYYLTVNKSQWWAYCQYYDDQFRIRLLPRYQNRRFFLDILAHEMVHIYEQMTYARMSHGPTFFRFKKLFERNGMGLMRTYEHDYATKLS